MATLAQTTEENKKDGEQQAPVTGGGSVTTPQSRVSGFSTGSQPTSGSGRFTNLQSYIKANQGAGQQLGSRITSGLEKETRKAGDVSQASQIGERVAEEKARLGKGTQYAEQVKGDPTQIAADEQQKKEFGQLLTNQNIASNLATQQQTAQAQQMNQLAQAQQNVQKLGNEAGRFQLLQKSVKSPGYGTGQQRLDQLFLQTSDPNVLAQKQRELSRGVAQSEQTLGEKYGTLAKDIAGAGQQARDVSELLRGTLAGEASSFEEAQAKEAEQLRGQSAVANTAMETFFKSGYANLTPEQKAVIDPMLESGQLQAGMRTYNVLKDPEAYKKYMDVGRTDLTAQDVVDQQELARIQALKELGASPSLDYTKVGDRGPIAGIKGQQLASDISAARQALEQQLNRQDIGGTGNIQYQANLLDLLKYQEGGAAGALPLSGSNVFSGQNIGFENRGQAGTFDPTNLVARYTAAKEGSGYLLSPYQQALQDMINKYQTELDTAGYNSGLGGYVGSPTPTNTFNVK